MVILIHEKWGVLFRRLIFARIARLVVGKNIEKSSGKHLEVFQKTSKCFLQNIEKFFQADNPFSRM